MEKLNVLFVSQEIYPFIKEEKAITKQAHDLSIGLLEKGHDIRVFMPRFGCINERRHQLHEVIRLSGINLIVNDIDHQLIIKVASMPNARMQVYFIDNEDFFSRKFTVTDEKNKFFSDNDERTIFFCKAVLETVKKLYWVPNIIHCQGWMSFLLPLYLKTSYKDEPLFVNSKVFFSLFNDRFEGKLDKSIIEKLSFDGIKENYLKRLRNPDYTNIIKLAIEFADAVSINEAGIDNEIKNFAKKKQFFYDLSNNESFVDMNLKFYKEIISSEVFAD